MIKPISLTAKPIILIDDDPEDIELIRQVITEMHCDHPVISFADPVKALAYFRENNSGVLFILCDLNMPKMTGLQLRRQMIDDADHYRNTAFYLFSTGNTDRDRLAAGQLELDGYFVKPASYEGIKELLAHLINASA